MPLIKKCSTEAFSKNISTEVRSGRDQKQAVAIAFSTLKAACGVKGKERMTPKEIVKAGGGKTEQILVPIDETQSISHVSNALQRWFRVLPYTTSNSRGQTRPDDSSNGR